jgi:hypothetical protein
MDFVVRPLAWLLASGAGLQLGTLCLLALRSRGGKPARPGAASAAAAYVGAACVLLYALALSDAVLLAGQAVATALFLRHRRGA